MWQMAPKGTAGSLEHDNGQGELLTSVLALVLGDVDNVIIILSVATGGKRDLADGVIRHDLTGKGEKKTGDGAQGEKMSACLHAFSERKKKWFYYLCVFTSLLFMSEVAMPSMEMFSFSSMTLTYGASARGDGRAVGRESIRKTAHYASERGH